jgi:hypothetical protein
MGDIFILVIFFLISLWSFYMAYQALKYNKTYTYGLTKTLIKSEISPRSRSLFVGIFCIVAGLFLFLFSVTGILEKIS